MAAPREPTVHGGKHICRSDGLEEGRGGPGWGAAARAASVGLEGWGFTGQPSWGLEAESEGFPGRERRQIQKQE